MKSRSKFSHRYSRTPQTTNLANQRAIDLQIEAYDICKLIGDDDHRHAFNNAINTLRSTPVHVTTMEEAAEIKWITEGAMGQFVVEAAAGGIPQYLQNLRDEKELFLIENKSEV